MTGVYPHDNQISRDGRRLYNSSIGPLAGMSRPAGAPPLTERPGHPFQLTVADVDTLAISDRIEFEHGIRPWHFTPDEKGLYAQLSNQHAVIVYTYGAESESPSRAAGEARRDRKGLGLRGASSWAYADRRRADTVPRCARVRLCRVSARPGPDTDYHCSCRRRSRMVGDRRGGSCLSHSQHTERRL